MSNRFERRKLGYLSKFREVARAVKELVVQVDPEARVYICGSLLRGRFTASSDIDILVVSERPELEYRIKTLVYGSTEAPVQIHFCSREKLETWYMKFLGEMEEV
jgi:predicted nucleotidyltransferase